MTTEDGRMNPEVKEDVIQRLLDPNARQGHMRLRSDLVEGDGDGGVCCLELVCQSAIAAGVIRPPRFSQSNGIKSSKWVYGKDDDTSPVYLPDCVREFAGLDSPDPLFDMGNLRDRGGDRYFITWSDLNDSLRLSLPQIADMVRHFF